MNDGSMKNPKSDPPSGLVIVILSKRPTTLVASGDLLVDCDPAQRSPNGGVALVWKGATRVQRLNPRARLWAGNAVAYCNPASRAACSVVSRPPFAANSSASSSTS